MQDLEAECDLGVSEEVCGEEVGIEGDVKPGCDACFKFPGVLDVGVACGAELACDVEVRFEVEVSGRDVGGDGGE